MKRYEQDKLYPWVVTLFIGATMLVDCVRDLGGLFLPWMSQVVEPLRNGVYGGCLGYVGYLFIRYGLDGFDALLTLLSMVIWALSVALTPEITSLASTAILLFYSRVYVGIVLLRHVRDVNRLARCLVWLTPLALLYAGLTFFQSGASYMTMSYNLLPIALFLMLYGWRKRKWLLLAAGAACFFIAGLMGSRGALLGGLAGLTCYVLADAARNFRRMTRWRLLAYGAALMCLATLFVFSGQIVDWMTETFADSRTLQMLLSGNLTTDSGRRVLYDRILEAIDAELFRPHGLLADRLVIGGSDAVYTNYPHSLVYEVVYQFGLLLAIPVLGAIAFLLVRKALRATRMDEVQLVLLCAFVPVAFVQLTVSGSYLISWLFGIAMGLLLARDSRPAALRR